MQLLFGEKAETTRNLRVAAKRFFKVAENSQKNFDNCFHVLRKTNMKICPQTLTSSSLKMWKCDLFRLV